MTESSDRRQENRAGVMITLGYALWIVIAIAGCFAVYYFDNIQTSQRPKAELPTATPGARITPDDTSNANKIFEEHFVNSPNNWTALQRSNRFSMPDGSLVLETMTAREFAAVDCIYCVSLGQPYYLQAALSTDTETPDTYGILFRFGSVYPDLFYSYLINARDKEYFLNSLSGDSWALHSSGTTDYIKPYPNSNTLGIYVQNDYLEMYINGNRVDTYQETNTSFQKGSFGFYIDDSGPRLIVRNVFIYAIK